MFFISERSIIICLACLPLNKEQNQSYAPNAPSPFTQKTTFSPLPALSSQIGFPPPKSCPQLQIFLSAKLFQTSLLWRLEGFISLPLIGSVTELGSAGGCRDTPACGQ